VARRSAPSAPQYVEARTATPSPRLLRVLSAAPPLLAIPHLLIVAILFSGGAWLSWSAGGDVWTFGGDGVVGVLVLAAAIMLAVTGQYPQPLFDIIVGLNRWGCGSPPTPP
jgi:hypothetical protein